MSRGKSNTKERRKKKRKSNKLQISLLHVLYQQAREECMTSLALSVASHSHPTQVASHPSAQTLALLNALHGIRKGTNSAAMGGNLGLC